MIRGAVLLNIGQDILIVMPSALAELKKISFSEVMIGFHLLCIFR